MKARYLLYFIFSIIFSACKRHSSDTIIVNTCDTIYIAQGALKTPWFYSGLFKNVNIIQLETNDSCRIKKVDKLQYIGKRFYLLDKESSCIFTFDEQGKFLWKINPYNIEAGKYNQVISFDVNKNNLDLYLYVDYPPKLMVYNFLGHFKKEQHIGLNASAIAFYNGYLFLHSGNQQNIINKKQITSQLFIQELSNDSLYDYLPTTLKDNNHICYIYQNAEAFHHYNKELLFFMPFSPNVYAIKNNQVTAKYYINFGNYTLPQNISIEKLINANYAYGLNTFWENDNYCFFRCNIKQKPYYFIYEKKYKYLIYTNFMSDNIGGFSPEIVTATNNHMLGYQYVDELLKNVEHQKENKYTKSKPISKLVKQLSEKDNPVIFLYNFK